MLLRKYEFPSFQGSEGLAEGDARGPPGVEGSAQLRRPRRHEGPARPADHLRPAGEYRGEKEQPRSLNHFSHLVLLFIAIPAGEVDNDQASVGGRPLRELRWVAVPAPAVAQDHLPQRLKRSCQARISLLSPITSLAGLHKVPQ